MRSDTGGAAPSEPTGAPKAPATPRRSSRGGTRVLLGLALAGAFVTWVAQRSEAMTAPGASKSAFNTAPSPIPAPDRALLFAVAIEDGRTLARLDAQKDLPGGESRDLYGLGEINGKAPALRLEARWGVASPAPASLFVEMAESAARMGAVIAKLGDVQSESDGRAGIEWASANISAGAGERVCVAFRLSGQGAARFAGFLCPSRAALTPPSADLRCLIDKLPLSAFGKASGFDALLRGPPAKRGACKALVG